jgi:hypothetical protein
MTFFQNLGLYPADLAGPWRDPARFSCIVGLLDGAWKLNRGPLRAVSRAERPFNMIPAFLFALVLAQAQGPAAAEPETPATASSPASSSAIDESDIPKGAPTDDYGLVAWCRGALTGHMALYTLVKPEMKSMERPGEVAYDEKSDAAQMQAGREYLALYARAMQAAEKTDPKLITRGLALRSQGEGIWTEAKAAAPRKRMWSWLMWDLPGECEVSANRLLGAPTLRTQ